VIPTGRFVAATILEGCMQGLMVNAKGVNQDRALKKQRMDWSNGDAGSGSFKQQP
jgi:hypothetical protein